MVNNIQRIERGCLFSVPYSNHGGSNSRVQVTPLARPVTRGVFGMRPVPSAVPISMPASGAPDADRWAVRCATS